MRLFLFLTMLAVPFLLCSCRTGVTYDGNPCYALSESEMDDLVNLARASLQKPHRQLTPEEVRTINKTKPEIHIRYTGDCSGEAKIRWVLKTKIAGIRYYGLLNDYRHRAMIFEIVPNNSDRIIYKGVPGKKDTPQ